MNKRIMVYNLMGSELHHNSELNLKKWPFFFIVLDEQSHKVQPFCCLDLCPTITRVQFGHVNIVPLTMILVTLKLLHVI